MNETTQGRPGGVRKGRSFGAPKATMRAIVQDTYGSSDVLEMSNIDVPVIGDDEVLIRVRAAGLDRGVWHVMAGLPYLIRLMGFGLRAPNGPVRGREVAGTVEAVGKDVTNLRPGDEVFGVCEAAFAEYASARGDKVVPKPANLTLEQAAALPISGITALQGLRNKGQVQPGQKVLIVGASGGVGTYAVQMAKAFGGEVTGVCSTSKMDLVRSIGADHVIDYTREDIADRGELYDLILDIGGSRSLAYLRRALTPHGTLVIVGGEEGGRLLGALGRIPGLLLSPFLSQKMRFFVASEKAEDLRELKELVESGRVTPVVERTYPLGEAPDAIRHMEEGRIRGKAVITV